MDTILLVILAALFLGMLLLNVYFRLKVFKAYKELVQNKVEFDFSHVFSSDKRKREILEKYPQHSGAIEAFIGHMRKSIRMATVLILLITAIGAVLMYYR